MNKLRSLYLLFLICFICIVGKLFYVQVAASDKFYSNNYLRTERITPHRGEIYDRNNAPLVLNETRYKLTAEPRKIENPDEVIKKIDELLQIGEATLEARIKGDKTWVPLKSGITSDQKKAIEKLQIKGLGFEKEEKRYYPEASTAAHLLGFVGKTADGDDTGYFGIEGFYEKDLAGLPGLFKSERDVVGKPIFVGVQDIVKSENGRKLVLTIDKTVQLIAKKRLQEGMEKFGAKEGCVITMNPKTGEILALVCLPDFDPEKYGEFNEGFFKNPTISTLYEPGSIFKPLVMGAALNEKVLKPDDYYNETGPVYIGKYSINTWNDKYEGKITMTRVLEKSSNVGMVYTGSKLGNKKLIEYIKRFGMGEKTGIDLQGETAGILKTENQMYPIDYATQTFGQGIVVTPIQMIRAFASLVNGGNLMRPYIVKEILSESGDKKEIIPIKERQVISEKASIQMRAMLQSTVEHAEAKWKRPQGYKIGGKTGTAQIPVEGHYDASKTIASFVGFAPASDPKFITLVMFKEPKSSPWGSETAAPVFFDIARELLVYYNIAPE